MSPGEIGLVMRTVAMKTSDFKMVNGKPIFGPLAIELMLFITISVFPGFYEQNDFGMKS